jgi:alpha-L-fucosidase
MPVDEYHATAVTFDPQSFDPKEWARLAKRLGMDYAVLTAKHHDGYAMFHTGLSDFSVEHSPFGRDIFREFADAMRAEGIRVGVYFSLIDWHHPDYPAFTDADKPYKYIATRRSSPEEWARFTDFMFGQVRELLTEYGPIDLLWFDGGWERTPEEWRAAELHAMIRELQPDIVINDRLPGFGDYDTPEQFVPPPQGPSGQPPARPWEVCMTINESWGYNPSDTHFKSSRDLVHMLCETASRGGRFLLNVSPMGDGRLQPELLERLEDIARWMERNREATTGTEPGLEPWQFYGPSTRKGDTVYLHLLMRPYETVTARGVPVKRVKSVRALSTGEPLEFTTRTAIIDRLLNADPPGEVVIRVPESVVDEYATVIAVEVEGSS